MITLITSKDLPAEQREKLSEDLACKASEELRKSPEFKPKPFLGSGVKPFIARPFTDEGRIITDEKELKSHYNSNYSDNNYTIQKYYACAIEGYWNWYSRQGLNNIKYKIKRFLLGWITKSFWKPRWNLIKMWYFKKYKENDRGYIGKPFPSRP